jgi:hypothetical protein
MLRRALPLILVAACGTPDAPVQLGFTGTCKLRVQRDSRTVQTLLTPDQVKTRVRLRLDQGTLVALHVEAPDYRGTSTNELEPDHRLLVGDARPNVPLDPETDVDVPVRLAPKGASGDDSSAWELPVRVVFHGRTAEAIVGRMHATGDCVPAPPPGE